MRISDWSSDVCSSDLDDADASTPRPRQPIFVQWAIVDPRDAHVSPAGALQPRQDRHQRRFSRTRWSQYGQALPPNNRKVDALQYLCGAERSEEHTTELTTLMRNSYAVLCLQKKMSKE